MQVYTVDLPKKQLKEIFSLKYHLYENFIRLAMPFLILSKFDLKKYLFPIENFEAYTI